MKKLLIITLLSTILLTACSPDQAEDTASLGTHRFTGEVIEVLGNEVTVEGMLINLQEMAERKAMLDNEDQTENRQQMENRDEQSRSQGNGRNFETETLMVTIPIGIDIVELQYDEEGNALEEEASLSDIKKGKTIQISYNETPDHIVQVSIIDSENMTPGMGGMGGMMSGGGGKR